MVVDRALLPEATSCYDKAVTLRTSPCAWCNTAPAPSPLPSFTRYPTPTAACPAGYSSWGKFSLSSSSSIYCTWTMITLTLFFLNSLSGIPLIWSSSISILFSLPNCWECFVFYGTEKTSDSWESEKWRIWWPPVSDELSFLSATNLPVIFYNITILWS